jgi:hypothetical protein
LLVRIRDRSLHPEAAVPVASAGFRTAMELYTDGEHVEFPPDMLVGMLDASGFGVGKVSLRAFRVV